MRFLLFNIAVIAALFFLFSGGRGDLPAVAGYFQERVGEALKSREEMGGAEAGKVADEVGGAWRLEPAVTSEDRERLSEELESDSLPGKMPRLQGDPPGAEMPGSMEWASLLAETQTEEQGVTSYDGEELPPPPDVQVAEVSPGLLPVEDPAVAQRRAEVLDGIDLSAPSAAPVADPVPAVARPAAAFVQLADGEALMNNRERLKQLHILAEEMELLFVEKLAK